MMVCVDLTQRSGYSIEQDGDISFGLVGFGDDAVVDGVEAVMFGTKTAYSSPDDVLYIYIYCKTSRRASGPAQSFCQGKPMPRTLLFQDTAGQYL